MTKQPIIENNTPVAGKKRGRKSKKEIEEAKKNNKLQTLNGNIETDNIIVKIEETDNDKDGDNSHINDSDESDTENQPIKPIAK